MWSEKSTTEDTYVFEQPGPWRFYLFLDDNLIDILMLQDTGGFGYTVGEWQIHNLRIGTVNPGVHELKLGPSGEDPVMNQDYFYLSEGLGDWTLL